MPDKEILNRLGLKNIDELKSFLDFSNRSAKIKYFCENFDMPSLGNPEIVWSKEKNYYYLQGSDNPPASIGCYRIGWETVLYPGVNKSEKPKGTVRNPKGFPKGNIPKGYGSDWYFHRGHIFARQFHCYVSGNKILDEEKKDTKEIWSKNHIDSPKINLFTQFSVANNAQAEIENKVAELLKAKKSVYYEVKLVFRDFNDAIPIGTEVFFTQLSKPVEIHHYFIPNVDVGFNLSGTEFDYSDFYRNSYQEKIRNAFEDSGRQSNNYQVNEGKNYTIDKSGGNFSIREFIPPEHYEKELEKLKKYINEKYKVGKWKEVRGVFGVDGENVRIRGEVTLTLFKSGKLRIQGKSSEFFENVLKFILEYQSENN